MFLEAMIEAVWEGKVTAKLDGEVLEPEEHEEILRDDKSVVDFVVYTVPS